MRRPPAWAVCLFLAVAAAAVYWPVLHARFLVFDDDMYVTANTLVKKGLTMESVAGAFSKPSPGGWPHPLALMSHMLDVSLYGLQPAGHHASSVLLHIGAALFFFLALLRMTDDPWRSAFAAAVFALHPLQVESVAWVAERKNVLSGCLLMLTLWLYAGYARKPSRAGLAAVLAAAALTFMARSVLVGLPLGLLLLDFWPLRRRESWRRLVLEKTALLGLGAACAVLALSRAEAVTPMPLPMRLSNVALSAAAYLGKTVWPSGLCVFYPFPATLNVWKVAASALLLLFLTAAALRAAKKEPWWLFGWLWFAVFLAPYAGIVQVGSQAMADRYMYLPLAGLAMAAAWGAPEFLGEAGKTLGGALIVCALMVASGLQLRYWDDGLTLFLRARLLHPESAIVHDNLGAAFYDVGDIDDAIDEYSEAIKLKPDYVEARNNLAIALFVHGRAAEGLKQLERALSYDPTSEKIKHNLATMRETATKKGKLPAPGAKKR